MTEVLSTELKKRLEQLNKEVSFISDLKLDSQNKYVIDNREYTFEAYDFENETVTMLVEYDDEDTLKDFEENGGTYYKEVFFKEYTREEFIKQFNIVS